MEDKGNEIIINNIALMVTNAIKDVVAVEGEIRSMNTYGNSVFIKFHNGTCYQQPLVSLFTNEPLLDDLNHN
jgi:hypothetical protein